jgi:hypothetical protein
MISFSDLISSLLGRSIYQLGFSVPYFLLNAGLRVYLQKFIWFFWKKNNKDIFPFTTLLFSVHQILREGRGFAFVLSLGLTLDGSNYGRDAIRKYVNMERDDNYCENNKRG